ncbi:uncharacterized RING finger protein ECU07_0330-like [Abrus precatorius]|uniref:Uncharacterized RING finger protein ECU07_0330-like n=1 Tax=Abrus precatorius TaxID=3816 RepID=A0A8B8M6K1_ABRPR|nr:uncharacterized RING finger protein ECU07_0330-like [Abrus precatorius]
MDLVFHRLFHPFVIDFNLSGSEMAISTSGEELRIRYDHVSTSVSREDCAVCLCNMGETEEVITLRCDHLFHRVCIDKWVGFNSATCPLCRHSMGPTKEIGKLSAEIQLFESCSINPHDYEIKWLR